MKRIEMIEQLGRHYYDLYCASAVECGKTPLDYAEWLLTDKDTHPGYKEDKHEEKGGTSVKEPENKKPEEKKECADCSKCGKCKTPGVNKEEIKTLEDHRPRGYKYTIDENGCSKEELSGEEIDELVNNMLKRSFGRPRYNDIDGYRSLLDDLTKGLFFI